MCFSSQNYVIITKPSYIMSFLKCELKVLFLIIIITLTNCGVFKKFLKKCLKVFLCLKNSFIFFFNFSDD